MVDNEKEPCGCPPPPHPGTNEFPVAQSAGLAPLPKPAPRVPRNSSNPPQVIAPLVYKSADHAAQPAAETQSAAEALTAAAAQAVAAPEPPATNPIDKNKHKFFHKVGHFFRRIFGAE